MSGTHYGASMTPEILYPWAKSIANDIAAKFADKEHIRPILVYRGMSGIATATAIMAFLPDDFRNEVGQAYVRKENEDSHGCKVEFSYTVEQRDKTPIFIFCDDFVDEGNTLIAVISAMIRLRREEIAPDKMLYALSKYSDIPTLLKFGELFKRHWDGTNVPAYIKSECDEFYQNEKKIWEEQQKNAGDVFDFIP